MCAIRVSGINREVRIIKTVHYEGEKRGGGSDIKVKAEIIIKKHNYQLSVINIKHTFQW
jgi:hypothetical protein